MMRIPNVGLRFQRYADGEFNYFEGVESCDECGCEIERGETFVHIELWNRRLGYGEVSLCSVQCERDYALTGLFHSRPTNINAISVGAQPKDSWVVLPSPPEYGGVVDWEVANSWQNDHKDLKGGDVRYRGQYARDPYQSFMSVEQKRAVMLETRDADGLSMSDFSDREKTLKIDLSEATTLSDLDLILKAQPIDAHNQVENDEKKRIGGGE